MSSKVSNRNSLRSAILGSSVKFKSKIVEVNGESYEVREPSKGLLIELFDKCKDESGQLNNMNLTTWAAIYSTYVPDTDEKVFEEGDFDTLNSLPISSAVNKIIVAAAEMLNAEEDIEKK